MPRKRTTDSHLRLFEELQHWAIENQLLKNPYVSGLLQALENRKNLAFWASLNPIEFLPFPRIQSSRRRISSLLSLIRNILIFVPVALTWTAVGAATTAFQAYNVRNPNNVSNFLDFWQNGYGLLDNFWKIGHIATLDAIIIGVVIALIIVIHFLNLRINLDEKNAKFISDQKRLALAISLGEYLFTKRSISDLTMKDSLANATNDLLQSSKNINNTSKDLLKLTKDNSISKIVSILNRDIRKSSDFVTIKNRKFEL